MALFKILRGSSDSLAQVDFHDGYAYFTPEDGMFYIDYDPNENGTGERIPINNFDRGWHLLEVYATGTYPNYTITAHTAAAYMLTLLSLDQGKMPLIKFFYDNGYMQIFYPCQLYINNGSIAYLLFTNGKEDFLTFNPNGSWDFTSQQAKLEATFSMDLISGDDYAMTIGPAINSSEIESLANQISEVVG